MGDSAHTTHHTKPGEKSAHPLFLEDENIFQKSAPLVPILLEYCDSPWNQRSRFLKNVLIFEKKGGADAFENDPPFRSKPTVHTDLTVAGTVFLARVNHGRLNS
jgi:hypothetical protein